MDFEAVDALLASVTADAQLPPLPERKRLRRAARLTQAQVAHAVGVSRETISAWESGRWEPTGDARTKYRRLLEGLQNALSTATDSTPDALQRPSAAPQPSRLTPPTATHPTPHGDARPPAAMAPCVLCGQPAAHEVEGYPQHLEPAECGSSAAAPTTATASPTPDPALTTRTPRTRQTTFAPQAKFITDKVHAALTKHQGDTEAATAEVLRKAIPDAMELLDLCRTGGRYDVIGHPPLPDILKKKTARGADDIWEARPRWTRPYLPPGTHHITALDINGAYLSALKTHLPLGALERSTGNVHSTRRAGIHLITPPVWDHDTDLPNPLGAREEPGPLWVTEPTLRLLQRLATAKHGPLCESPIIHESFTSGSTENLFEKFRQILRDVREEAIANNDEITLEYVKSMYSKFVSTMGESNYNRDLYRPDWMHIIRSQAFVNLWLKAHKAHMAGLPVIRVMGTDELHVAGDWRKIFTEGRGVSQVKVKDMYTTHGERVG